MSNGAYTQNNEKTNNHLNILAPKTKEQILESEISSIKNDIESIKNAAEKTDKEIEKVKTELFSLIKQGFLLSISLLGTILVKLIMFS